MIRRLALWTALALAAVMVVVVQSDRQSPRNLSAAALVPSFARVVAAQAQVETRITLGALTRTDVQLTRQVVRLRPAPARSLLLHAQAATNAGLTSQVLPPLEVAATRGWREPLLQALAGRAALAGADYAAATNRAAALLATGRAPGEVAFLLNQLMDSQQGRSELAGLLGRPGHYSRHLWPSYAASGSPAQLVAIARLARQRDIASDCEAIGAIVAAWRTESPAEAAALTEASRC